MVTACSIVVDNVCCLASWTMMMIAAIGDLNYQAGLGVRKRTARET